VHRREVVASEPWIVFPGNLQGRHVRETGAKGATLLHVEDGRIVKLEERALDVVRFCQLRVDATAAETLGDIAQRVKQALRGALCEADGRLLAARVHVVGAARAHAELARDPERARAQVQSTASDIQGGDVWLEDVRFATEAALDRTALASRDDALGQLIRSLEGASDDEALVRSLSDELSELLRALPAELRDPEFGLDLNDPEQVRELLDSARRQLLPRLLGM
jgi:hypothetical protein